MSALSVVLITCVLFTVYGIMTVASKRLYHHGVHVLAWRWLTGEAHHGRPQTTRGWLRPAHGRALTPTGHARRLYYFPRWQHALYRSGLTAVVFLLAADLLAERSRAVTYLAVTGTAGAVYESWRGWEWARSFTHRRNYVKPTHLRLAPMVGIPAAARPESWLEIAPDRTQAVLTFPKRAEMPKPQEKQAIEAAAAGTLGMRNARPKWQVTGPAIKLRLVEPVRPPKEVRLDGIEWDGRSVPGVPPDAIQRALVAADVRDLVLGIGEDGQTVTRSLENDSPHLALSVNSGGGKSVLVRCILSQVLFRGGWGAILDNKLVSHPWARALPNVAYADDIDKIHFFLEWLDGYLVERAAYIRANTDIYGNLRGSPGPPLLVVMEEQNLTKNRLLSYWEEQRALDKALPKDERQNLPATSPAIRGFENASYVGRELGVHLAFVSQRFTADAAGGGSKGAAVRMNTGIRILGGYDQPTWELLVGRHPPMPPPSSRKGRMQVHVRGGDPAETQVAFFTHEQARQLATGGHVREVPPWLRHLTVFDMPGVADAERAAALDGAGRRPGAKVIAGEPPQPIAPRNWMTVRQARDAGILPATWSNPGASFRVAKHRAARRGVRVPEVVGKDGAEAYYDAVELSDFLEQITS